MTMLCQKRHDMQHVWVRRENEYDIYEFIYVCTYVCKSLRGNGKNG